MKIGAYARALRATQEQTVGLEPKPPSHNAAIAALVILLVVGAFVLFTPQGQSILNGGLGLITGTNSSTSATYSGSTSLDTTAAVCPSTSVSSLMAPDIHGNQASIWYPSDYCVLANYALGLVNQDRTSNQEAPVSLSFALAAQQHVDSMLYYDYFAHNDTQGYKPYMRYSFLGATGADFENVAIIFRSHFTSTGDVEAAIRSLEDAMMNKDVTCCANLHRDNILAPLHTRVSIGVAYNSTTVYFGEEFENYYISLSFSPAGPCTLSGSCEIVMTGIPTDPTVTSKIDAVFVSYDKTPSPATASQLDSGPREYGPGLLVGGALMCANPILGCATFANGTTVYADTWTVTSSRVDIRFSLHDFILGQNGMPGHGAGVYTIYVVIGDSTNDALTSISVVVD